MERAILIAIALFGLVVWRVVFTLLEQWPSPRATPPPRQRKDTLAKQRRPHWLLPCVELTTGIGWGPGSSRIDLVQAESRADMYLRRVIALTGATQNGKSYFLDVDTTRFQVWDRFIMRLRGSADPKGRYYEETCFGPAFQGMPRAERIATVLLQLRNNPELFDKWVKKETAFKADGQPFRRGAAMILE